MLTRMGILESVALPLMTKSVQAEAIQVKRQALTHCDDQNFVPPSTPTLQLLLFSILVLYNTIFERRLGQSHVLPPTYRLLVFSLL